MPKRKQVTGHITKTFSETLRSQEIFVDYLYILKKYCDIKHFTHLCITAFNITHEFILRKQIRLVIHIPDVTDDAFSANVCLDQFRKKLSTSSF